MERWANSRGTPLDISLVYYSPEKHVARMCQSIPTQFRFFHDDLPLPFYPVPMTFVHLPQRFRERNEVLDELALLAELLSVDQYLAENLISAVTTQNAGEFGLIEITAPNPGRLVLTFDASRKKMVRLTELSDSAHARLLLELCVARARVSSRVTPTMLLLENLHSLDGSNMERYVKYLALHDFQTIITLPRTPTRHHGASWESVRLRGTETDVVINQSYVA
ncbi:MAG: hypothetical protein WKF77_19925 [Planctomycetaceae bacterium]